MNLGSLGSGVLVFLLCSIAVAVIGLVARRFERHPNREQARKNAFREREAALADATARLREEARTKGR